MSQPKWRAWRWMLPLVVVTTGLGAAGLRRTDVAFNRPSPTYDASVTLLVSSVDTRIGNVAPAQLPVLATSGDVATGAAARVRWRGPVAALRATVRASLDASTTRLVISTTQPSAASAVLVADAFADELQSLLSRRRRDDLARRLGASELEIADLEAEVAELAAQELGNPGDALIAARHAAAVKAYESSIEDRRKLDDVLSEEAELTAIDRARAVARPPDTRALDAKRTALGAALGALLGIEACLLILISRRRLRRRDETEAVTGVPVLAELPTFPRAGGRRSMRRLVEPDVADDRSARSLRELRHALGLVLDEAQPVDRPADIVVVCSAHDRDGKSTLAANLAAAFARPDLRVIVVNADHRGGDVTRFFETHDDRASAASSDDDRTRVPRATSVPGLSVLDIVRTHMTGGPSPADGARGEGDHSIARSAATRVAALRSEAELIVVDTASIEETTAALELMAVASHVLMIVRAGRTQPQRAARTAGLLRFAGARSLSIVMTDCGNRSSVATPAAASTPPAAPPSTTAATPPQRTITHPDDSLSVVIDLTAADDVTEARNDVTAPQRSATASSDATR